ncbi:MAG: PP2C family protein-serine/threonine phosphatase, partial [Bacteroidia bacterium]
ELNDTMLSSDYDQWRNTNQNSFSFTNNDRIYWAQVSPYILGNINFYVGVVAPEDEIIGSIIKTKKILLLGILLISIVSVYIGYAYRQKIKTNKQLNEKNNIIENQKKEVDEKNREIIDSINYAKRIQNALLPSISNFDKNFNEYFVLYMPKDIVAGDFYWFQEHDRKVYLAVADCTGHGVPGAMVSVICINALNRVLKEFEITETGKLLDKTKELIIHEFEKSDSTVQDGMDIALVSIDFAKNEIQYSGANNSLWLIKSGEDRITEIKADKQPIGKYISETSFGTKKITMNKGDVYYLFSDGYADQFGGPKGKKFKYKQLNELLVKLSTKRMDKQQHELKQAFDFWRGALEQVDDVTLIGIRI